MTAENQIIEIKTNNVLSFILTSSKSFSEIDFKVLRTHMEKGFARCNKAMLNDNIQLVYDIEGYQSLETVFQHMTMQQLTGLLKKCTEAIRELHTSGYMQERNLLLDMKYLYLKEGENRLGLIYLPVVKEEVSVFNSLDDQIKGLFLHILSQHWHHPELADLNRILRDGQSDLRSVNEEVTRLNAFWSVPGESKVDNANEETVCEENQVAGQRPQKNDSEKVKREKGISEKFLWRKKRLRLKDVETDKVLFEFTRDGEYVVGSKKELADIFIDDRCISKSHCKIYIQGTKAYIEDLDSKNGTKLNGGQIPSRNKRTLQRDDTIKLASHIFTVEIK